MKKVFEILDTIERKHDEIVLENSIDTVIGGCIVASLLAYLIVFA
jgi:hypothetical protein